MSKVDVYQQVTDRIIAAIEAGTAPWRRPWKGGGPVNVRNGRPYRGVNIFLLDLMGYTDPRWGTFRAVKEVGGHVRTGEKATYVILWKPVEKRAKGDEEEGERYLLLRSYAVFNAEQCEGLPEYSVGERTHTPHEAAEQIVTGYVPGPTIAHRGGQAFYSETLDLVQVPNPMEFESMEAYYSTLFHELVHSTGHKERLNRLEAGGFGTGPYAKEELVAEMGAAMLCGMVGIDNLDMNAAYLANWLEVFRRDKKFVVNAAALAQRACDHMVGTEFASQEAEKEEATA